MAKVRKPIGNNSIKMVALKNENSGQNQSFSFPLAHSMIKQSLRLKVRGLKGWVLDDTSFIFDSKTLELVEKQ